MKIEFRRKDDDWPGRNRYTFTLIDDQGEIVMVDEALSLDHAKRCAMQAARQLGCLAWCADCDCPAWQCQCVEGEAEIERAEWEQRRIRANRCPKCGEAMKDKGSYVRCTSCAFGITNGTWNTERGYAVQYPDPDEGFEWADHDNGIRSGISSKQRAVVLREP